MRLTEEFINICKLDLFDWCKKNLPNFDKYDCIVAKYYKTEFNLNDVLEIFDRIDGNKGYLFNRARSKNNM